MISLRKLKMKKIKGLFKTKQDVRKARIDLEVKTEKVFKEYDRNRQKR